MSFLLLILFFITTHAARNVYSGYYTKREVQELLRYEKANFLSESSPIRIVNVISGTPLVSEQDPTGGFGDIASNLFAARELKKRNPKLEINFIITTQNLSDDDIKYGVRRTDDIMKILVPSLDIHMYDKPQQIEGINFILLPQDAEAMSYKEYLNQHKSFGRTIIPSDLSIQFSANEFSKVAVLNSNSKVAFSFFEYGGNTTKINSVDTANNRVVYSTGPASSGLYIKSGLDQPSLERQTLINTWLTTQGNNSIDFANDRLAFTYTKESSASYVYVEAVLKLALKYPHQKFHILAKDFSSSNGTSAYLGLNIPPNVKLITFPPIADKLMDAFISESHLSPMLTGDLSVSTAISSVRAHKSFFYEILPWKQEFAKALRHKLIEISGEEHSVVRIFVTPTTKAESILTNLEDDVFNTNLAKKLRENRHRMDVLSQLPILYEFSRVFKYELQTFNAEEEIQKIGEVFLSAQSIEDVPRVARENLMNTTDPFNQVLAGLILLKSRPGMNLMEMQMMGKALSKLKDWQLARTLFFFEITIGRTSVQSLLSFLVSHPDPKIRTSGLTIFEDIDYRKDYNELKPHKFLDRILAVHAKAQRNGFKPTMCLHFYL